METFDLGRRIRDFIIPNIRKKYHITGQYLSVAAAAEVIQVVRLGFLAAGFGELTEEQLIELGTVLEPEVHQQLRPRSGGKKAVVYSIPTGEETEIEIDAAVLHTGRMQNNSLAKLFHGHVKEIHEIGDCRIAGGKIMAAIDDGYKVGMKI